MRDKQSDQDSGPFGRRQDPRIKPNQPIPVRLPDDTIRDDLIQDISLGGLRIQCDRATALVVLPTGGKIDPENPPVVLLHITFPTQGTRRQIPLKCQLRYVRGTTSGMIDFGMQFMEIDPQARKQVEKFIVESLMPAV